MINVLLEWTPSVSSGVDGQRVRIFDVDTLTVYGEVELPPDANTFECPVPEGTRVQGGVNTVRGEEEAAMLSNIIDVGYQPLQPATDATLVQAPVIQPTLR